MRSCIASQCMRESVFKACSTAFKQLSAPGCNCFGSTLATSGLSEALTLLLITDDLLDHLSACEGNHLLKHE